MNRKKEEWKIEGQIATGRCNDYTVRVEPATWHEYASGYPGEKNPPGGEETAN